MRRPYRMIVRPLEIPDIKGVLAIQSQCPETVQWAAKDYVNSDGSGKRAWVAMEDSKVLGFLAAHRAGPDLEILNLAVEPAARRRGIASLLLTEALDWGKQFHAERALLELRASNVNALHFYEEHRFGVVGRRPRYYTSPVDDAVLLTRTVC